MATWAVRVGLDVFISGIDNARLLFKAYFAANTYTCLVTLGGREA